MSLYRVSGCLASLCLWVTFRMHWGWCDCIVSLIERDVLALCLQIWLYRATCDCMWLHRVSDCLVSLCPRLTLWMHWGWCNCTMSRIERAVIASSLQMWLHWVRRDCIVSLSSCLLWCLWVSLWRYRVRCDCESVSDCESVNVWVCVRVCTYTKRLISYLSASYCTRKTSDVKTWMDHVSYLIVSCFITDCIVSSTQKARCEDMNESRLLSETWTSHVSYLEHEWIMFHIRVHRVWHAKRQMWKHKWFSSHM